MCPNDNVYILIRFSNRTNKETFYKNVPLKNPKNKKKEKSLLSFKFSNVFKIAPPLDNSSGVAEKQIQSFSKPSKTPNLDACFGFKITRHLRRDQKNGISVNEDASQNVCNSGVIGRGGFKRSSRASTFRGLWYAKIRQQRARTKARAVSSRVKKREREREEGKGNGKEKKKKKYGKKHELKSRARPTTSFRAARVSAQKSNG